MDSQPSSQFESHLFEYEMNNCDACVSYRLELKQVDSKNRNECWATTLHGKLLKISNVPLGLWAAAQSK